MKDIIRQLLSNNLQDLKGLKASGRIPVSTQLVNEVISQFLHPEPFEKHTPDATDSKDTVPKAGMGSAGNIDPMILLRQHLKTLEVQIEDGRIVIDFHFQVE